MHKRTHIIHMHTFILFLIFLMFYCNLQVQVKREEYQKEIEEIRNKLTAERVTASKGPVRRKNGVRAFPDFTGKQVAVPSEYYGLPDEIYIGTVHKWVRYDSTGGGKFGDMIFITMPVTNIT